MTGNSPQGGRLLNILPTVLLLQCVENAFTIASLSPFAKKMIVEGELTAEKLQWLAESPLYSRTMKKGMFEF